MSSRRKARLDALERTLTDPRRIGLFGHRAVGKTTLLAMFYREASAGRVPGVRLAAAKAATAEYLAEKIGQIESGEPLPATLAETELHLRLYRDRARSDLIVKDYQGEHVGLGSDAPIREFLADCDAVLLCLDPEGSAMPAQRRRRQQEVEELLERYIEASADGTTGRPVALLVTKYDHVLAHGGPPPEAVESFVDERFGMTRHVLQQHAPRSALFAVSSYGLEARDDRPPAELHPMGLEGPLAWLAEQLEAIDRERLDWIWDLAPEDLPRLARCVAAFERRYPQSDRLVEYRERLGRLRRKRLVRGLAGLAGGAALLAAGAAAYDMLGYQATLAFERDNPPTAVERRWQEFLAWHPSLRLLWPARDRQARKRLHEWTVKAAEQRVVAGTAAADLPATLTRLKDEAPELVGAIGRVEEARDQKRHEERWKGLLADDLAGDDRPEERAAAYRAFLREFPETAHREEARRRVAAWELRASDRRSQAERRERDALRRALALPDADLPGIVERARAFLDQHSESAWYDDVQQVLDEAVGRIDDADIQKARDVSRQFPTNFATRLRKYRDYLQAHRAGGRHVHEALDAIEQVERERDRYAYRQAFDHARAYPGDLAEVARRLRSYLDANPQGRYAATARDYLSWWETINKPGSYRVTVKYGEVEPDVGKYLSGGGPDLAVELWIAGVKYGPSPIAPNTHTPIWNYTFAPPIRWRYGDPVVIRILDFDWSRSGTSIFRLTSPKDDPLALRLFTGEVKPAKGGRTKLVFATDFRIPTLPRPE